MPGIKTYARKDTGSVAINTRVEPSNARRIRTRALDSIFSNIASVVDSERAKGTGSDRAKEKLYMEAFQAFAKETNPQEALSSEGIAKLQEKFKAKAPELLGHRPDHSVLDGDMVKGMQHNFLRQRNAKYALKEYGKTFHIMGEDHAKGLAFGLNLDKRNDAVKYTLGLRRRELDEKGLIQTNTGNAFGAYISPEQIEKTLLLSATNSLAMYYARLGRFDEASTLINQGVTKGTVTTEEAQALRKSLVSDINSRVSVVDTLNKRKDILTKQSYDKTIAELNRLRLSPSSQANFKQLNNLAAMGDKLSAKRSSDVSNRVAAVKGEYQSENANNLGLSIINGSTSIVRAANDINQQERQAAISPAQAIKLRSILNIDQGTMRQVSEGIKSLTGPQWEGLKISTDPDAQGKIALEVVSNWESWLDAVSSLRPNMTKDKATSILGEPPTAAAIGMFAAVNHKLNWSRSKIARVAIEGMDEKEYAQLKVVRAKVLAAREAADKVGNGGRSAVLQKELDMFFDLENKYKVETGFKDEFDRIKKGQPENRSFWDTLLDIGGFGSSGIEN